MSWVTPSDVHKEHESPTFAFAAQFGVPVRSHGGETGNVHVGIGNVAELSEKPVALDSSSSAGDLACPAGGSSCPEGSQDVSVLRSEIVRAVVSEIRTVMDEHYSNIKTELLDMKSELIRDFAALRSDFAGLKSTVSGMERSLSTCTDDMLALQAKVESLTKEISKLDAKCEDLESRSRRQNIRIVGIPEGESFTFTTSKVSDLLKEAFDLDKPPLVDRAHRTLAPKPKSGDPPQPIIARLHYYEDCMENFRKARRQQRVTISNMRISVFPDFTARVARARAAFNGVRAQLRGMEGIPYGTLYPARLRITHDGKHHDFTCPEEAGRFVATLTKWIVAPGN
ncbi:hypothetical protein NFI96_005366 [Prochilodus magdalenae]|nr:hypothetical protein NFI96_005366 [Prochilodus magdalenae]